MLVGTMRIVTVCFRLVARRALPRHVPVARHFKLVVPGVRADDLASPVLWEVLPVGSSFWHGEVNTLNASRTTPGSIVEDSDVSSNELQWNQH